MTKWMKAALAAILTAGALVLVACGGDTISTPTAEAPPPAVAAAPAPAPAAPAPNPSPTPAAGEEGPGYAIEFENNAGFKVTNQTDIGQEYRAYITSFDNQSAELAHKLSGTVPPNESWGDSFNRQCVQLDITQFGYAGLPLKGGAAYFDKDGKQFNDKRNPEKITECRTTPCVEEWLEIENNPEVSYGEWGACTPSQVEDDDIGEQTTPQCSKKRTVTITYTEQNSCTRATRKGRVVVREESAPCECPCVEQGTPGVKDYLPPVWSGTILQGACTYGPPQLTLSFDTVTSCHENGTQAWVTDLTCGDDDKGTINVCRPATCPPPPPSCANTNASSSAAQPFSLANSGEATETAWVNANVYPGPLEFWSKLEDFDDDCTTVGFSAKVVLLKAGTSYWYFLNVTAGQQLCSSGQDISHLSKFRCAED